MSANTADDRAAIPARGDAHRRMKIERDSYCWQRWRKYRQERLESVRDFRNASDLMSVWVGQLGSRVQDMLLSCEDPETQYQRFDNDRQFRDIDSKFRWYSDLFQRVRDAMSDITSSSFRQEKFHEFSKGWEWERAYRARLRRQAEAGPQYGPGESAPAESVPRKKPRKLDIREEYDEEVDN